MRGDAHPAVWVPGRVEATDCWTCVRTHPTKGAPVKLQMIVSSTRVATQVVDALDALGHRATTVPDLPGLVVVDGLDPSDAPTVQRIAAMMDHPTRTAVPA